MARARIIRQTPAALLENPLYFSALLRRRLEISNFFSQRAVHYRICAYNRHFISVPCDLGDLLAERKIKAHSS